MATTAAANASRPIRRIVCLDDAQGKSLAVSDAPVAQVHVDPARPGFESTRVWVTDRTPSRMKVGGVAITETLDSPHTIEPPPGGSLCRMVTFPPDDSWSGRVSARDVQAFFESMGSPQAATGNAGAPHPYMRYGRAARHEPCMEQPLGQTLPRRFLVARWGMVKWLHRMAFRLG